MKMKIKSIILLNSTEKKAFKEQLILRFPMINDYSFTHNYITKQDDLYCFKVKVHDAAVVDVFILNYFPIAFVVKKKLFPSIFFLWEYPECLLSFSTYSDVVTKLVDGAYVMLSGVAYPKFSPDCTQTPKFKRHAPVYLNVTSNKAAVAVGITDASSETFCRRRNKGRCVLLLHFWGDSLCTIAYMNCLPIPQLGYPQWLKNSMKSISSIHIPTQQKLKKPIMCDKYVETQKSMFTLCSEIEIVLMDKLISRCFLTVIKYSKRLSLPILLSTFCNTYLTPSCSKLNIKKSSYRKFTNFIMACSQEGFIKLDYRNGAYMITQICRDHPTVLKYRYDPDKRPHVRIINEPSPIFAEDCYSVTLAVLPIFEYFGFFCGSVILCRGIKKYVRAYIKYNGLVHQDCCRLVRLNRVLRSLSPDNTDHIFLQDISIVFKNVVRAMCHCYLIRIKGIETVHKGKLPPIIIQEVFTFNCKKVAIIRNTKLYGIELTEIIKYCHYYGVTSAKIIKMGCFKKIDVIQFESDKSRRLKHILHKNFGIPITRIIHVNRQ